MELMSSWKRNTVVLVSSYEQKILEKDIRKRCEVIGSAFVDKALGAADELTMPMQDLVTRVDLESSDLVRSRSLSSQPWDDRRFEPSA